MQRWPVQLDTDRGEFHIGPPRQLPLPASDLCDRTRTDRAGSWPWPTIHDAYVATPERTIRVGPLDDCRGVAVSPDGEWLATGSHRAGGAQVWRIRDGAKVAELPIDGATGVNFSPDGKWLMTDSFAVPALGSRHLARGAANRRRRALFLPRRPAGGRQRCEQGHPPGRDRDRPHARAARKPRPVRRGMRDIQPRRVAAGGDHQRAGPAVHVWDLRAIRKHSPRWASTGTRRPIPTTTRPDPRRPPCPRSRSTTGDSAP